MSRICNLSESKSIITSYVLSKPICHIPDNIAEAKYCEYHGCHFCNYVSPKSSFSKSKKKIEADLGEGEKKEVCSVECRIKAEQQKFDKTDEEEQEKRKVFIEKSEEHYNETITEIKNIFAPFYEIIKEVRINELKKEFLKGRKKPFEFYNSCCASIDKNSSLKPSEKEE